MSRPNVSMVALLCALGCTSWRSLTRDDLLELARQPAAPERRLRLEGECLKVSADSPVRLDYGEGEGVSLSATAGALSVDGGALIVALDDGQQDLVLARRDLWGGAVQVPDPQKTARVVLASVLIPPALLMLAVLVAGIVVMNAHLGGD